MSDVRPPFTVSPSRIARYFFHECDRFLRFTSASSPQRERDAIPHVELDRSLVTQSVLQSGFDWETKLLAGPLKNLAVIAPGDELTPVHQRRHDEAATLDALATLSVGQTLYQPTLVAPASMYERFGLDPGLLRFTDCHPDLLTAVDGEHGREIRVIDAKASDLMKLSHRIQVGMYSMLLAHVLEASGLPSRFTPSRLGGVWLYGHEQPEWFELSRVIPHIETFLERDLQPLLRAPAQDAYWHLYFRCEWCDYYSHCRPEAEQTNDVSLIPYLSTFAKRHLRERLGVNTVEELQGRLAEDDRDALFIGSGSLEGRAGQLALAVDALLSGQERPTGASSAGMPAGEHVRLLFTLQSEPVTGEIYCFAIARVGGNDLVGSDNRTIVGVAAEQTPDALRAVRTQFVQTLLDILSPIDEFNRANAADWRAQKTVQAFVFDGYERTLLIDLLLAEITEGPAAAEALTLLFWFQHPGLATVNDHPASEVFFPVVVMTGVLRQLVALPVPVVYRLADVNAALQPAMYGFTYQHNDFHSFELSNRMKSNAIFEIWLHGRADLLTGLEQELRFRVWAANSIVNGLRERLKPSGALFAWPPKFALPPGTGFRNATLSRLAFIARYEAVLSYLEMRTARTAPVEELLQSDRSILLIARGGGAFEIDPAQVEIELHADGFASWLLTVDDEAGRKARLAYDDFVYRDKQYAPKYLPAALASIERVVGLSLTLTLKPGAVFAPPAPGARCILDARFTDFTTRRLIDELAAIDADPAPWVARLLEDPVATREVCGSDGWRSTAMEVAQQYLTPSQLRALAGALRHDVQLIWGPPGTGKTHFLAVAILAAVEAAESRGEPLHVVVTAFTHAAIDNLLRKITQLAAELRLGVAARVMKVNGTLEGVDAVAHGHLPHEVGAHSWTITGSTVWQLRKVDAGLGFDLVVIDEGSQLTVGAATIPMRRLGRDGHLIIAGDDRQLPPIVQGAYPVEEGRPRLHRSILEALRDGDPDGEHGLVVPLLENFRMCDRLCEYPRQSIYPEGYLPASEAVAGRRLDLDGQPGDALLGAILDARFPLVVGIFEDVLATRANAVEADLVAAIAETVRTLTDRGNDQEFWHDRMFIVSPHHAQNRLIREGLASRRQWDSTPFVDTVDKMQGQECDLVVVSYGVSDVEFALAEKEFIYSRNRLNVSITRARAKTVLLLSRALLEPPIQALDHDDVADGIAFMQGLVHWCIAEGDSAEYSTAGGRLTLLRA
jgi:DNA replication ATP-dependent helicase Dna2